MNPYSGKIDLYTEEEIRQANADLKKKYGPKAKEMIGLSDEEAKTLGPMNRAQRRKWMKENGKFK